MLKYGYTGWQHSVSNATADINIATCSEQGSMLNRAEKHHHGFTMSYPLVAHANIIASEASMLHSTTKNSACVGLSASEELNAT